VGAVVKVRLTDAREGIMEAIRKLLDCPEVFRPFVIVEQVDGRRFVQFAGSTERGLLFDVPALEIVAAQVVIGPTDDLAVVGADLALAGLRKLGVEEQEIVRVLFESTGAVPAGLSGRRSPSSA
jgi:hypothetical protein